MNPRIIEINSKKEIKEYEALTLEWEKRMLQFSKNEILMFYKMIVEKNLKLLEKVENQEKIILLLRAGRITNHETDV